MRIAGGTLRGRTLKAPPGDVLRPTQDAVREALFSMLASVVPGCSFLDLYAGTGAVGLEAFSRGAAAATWVERSPRSLRLLEANLAACCGSPLPPGLRVVRADVAAWLRRPDLPPGSVDVAFAVVKGDTALSVASVNDFSDDGSVEINVETAPSERGQGYGSAVTYALCRYLLSLGERVSFRCRSTNAASPPMPAAMRVCSLADPNTTQLKDRSTLPGFGLQR